MNFKLTTALLFASIAFGAEPAQLEGTFFGTEALTVNKIFPLTGIHSYTSGTIINQGTLSISRDNPVLKEAIFVGPNGRLLVDGVEIKPAPGS